MDIFKYWGGKEKVRKRFAERVLTAVAHLDGASGGECPLHDRALTPAQQEAAKLIEDVASGNLDLITFDNMPALMYPLGLKLEDVFEDFTLPPEDIPELWKLAVTVGYGVMADIINSDPEVVTEMVKLTEADKLKLLILLYAFQQL